MYCILLCFVLALVKLIFKTMKKAQILLLTLSMAAMVSACYNRNHHTIIATENNQTKMRVEYAGRIVFNDDRSGIRNISKDGYFKYERDNQELKADNDGNNHVIYTLPDGSKSATLNDEGRQLLDEAIREINKAKGLRKH